MRLARSLGIALVVALLCVAAAAGHGPRKTHNCQDGLMYTFDETGWAIYAGPAEIGPNHWYHSPPVALSLSADGTSLFGSAAIIQHEEHLLVPGKTYDVRARLNADEAVEATPFRLFIGAFGNALFEARAYKSQLGAGGQLVEFGSFVVPDPNPGVMLIFPEMDNSGLSEINATGRWGVDDIEITEHQETAGLGDEMALDREPIYARLFERLAAVPGLAYSSRRLKPYADVPGSEQPALFLTTGDQTPENKLGEPPTWILGADVFLYVRMDDPETIPGAVLNALIKTIEEALEWRISDVVPGPVFAPTGRVQTTLGGLVQYAWIADSRIVEGVTAQQAAAHLSIEMRAAALVTA